MSSFQQNSIFGNGSSQPDDSVQPPNPFGIQDPQGSTKTKTTRPHITDPYMFNEDRKRENERLLEFLTNTVESRQFTSTTRLDVEETALTEGVYTLREDFLRGATGGSSSKTNAILDNWKTSRSDEPVLSISLLEGGVQAFQPKATVLGSSSRVDEITFAGGSIYNLLLDREAGSPQFTELLSLNAQTNYHAAVRARGGAKGELWTNAKAKSTWLNSFLTETETDRVKLDGWIAANPYAYDLGSSIPFSAYVGDSMLDILDDSEAPKVYDENGNLVTWDAKKAITELEVADPGLHKLLFMDMGVDPARLAELGDSPLKFKYFIADAIDNHAYQSYLHAYMQESGGWEQGVSLYAWPLLRDSFNSNDLLSELLITAGAAAATATGVGAAVGIPVLVGKTAHRIKKVIGFATRTYDTIDAVSKWGARASKASSFLWKAKKVMPSQITDTLWDASGALVAKEGAHWFRRGSYWTGRQFLGEASQGVLESAVLQTEAMMTGFQEEWSGKALWSNALEEGIGGLVLGGPIRGTQNISEALLTTKVGDKINKFIDATKRMAVESVIPKSMSQNMDIAVRLALGIPDGVTIEEFEGGISARLRMNAIFARLKESANVNNFMGGGEGAEKEDPLIEATVNALSKGDPRRDGLSRYDLMKRLEALMNMAKANNNDVENTSREDIDALLYLTAREAAGTDTAAVSRLNEVMWLASKKAEGVTKNKDGKPLSITDATEEELKALAAKMDENSNFLAMKLGVSSAKEINNIFGQTLTEEQRQTYIESLNELGKENAAKGQKEKIVVTSELPLKGILPDQVDPAQIAADAAQDAEVERQEAEAARLDAQANAEAQLAARQATASQEGTGVAPEASVDKAPTGLAPDATEGTGAAPDASEKVEDQATTPIKAPDALVQGSEDESPSKPTGITPDWLSGPERAPESKEQVENRLEEMVESATRDPDEPLPTMEMLGSDAEKESDAAWDSIDTLEKDLQYNLEIAQELAATLHEKGITEEARERRIKLLEAFYKEAAKRFNYLVQVDKHFKQDEDFIQVMKKMKGDLDTLRIDLQAEIEKPKAVNKTPAKEQAPAPAPSTKPKTAPLENVSDALKETNDKAKSAYKIARDALEGPQPREQTAVDWMVNEGVQAALGLARSGHMLLDAMNQENHKEIIATVDVIILSMKKMVRLLDNRGDTEAVVKALEELQARAGHEVDPRKPAAAPATPEAKERDIRDGWGKGDTITFEYKRQGSSKFSVTIKVDNKTENSVTGTFVDTGRPAGFSFKNIVGDITKEEAKKEDEAKLPSNTVGGILQIVFSGDPTVINQDITLTDEQKHDLKTRSCKI